jgi:hypothetical protein
MAMTLRGAVSVLSATNDRTVRRFWLAIGALIVSAICVLATRHPIAVLATLFVVVGLLALLRLPYVAMVALILFIPFHSALIAAIEVKAGLPLGPLAYWKDAVIVALFARAAWKRYREDGRFPVYDRADDFLIAYVLIFVAAAFISPSRTSVYPALGRYVEGPMMLLTLRWLRLNRRQLWGLVWVILGSAFVMAVTGLIERLGPQLEFQRWYGTSPGLHGEPFLVGASGYRAGSFLYDPLLLGFYMAGLVAFAAAVQVYRSRWRPLAILCFASCITGVVVAATRTGLIGGGIGVFIALALSFRNPRIRFSVLGIGIIVAGSLWLFYTAAGSGLLVRPDSDKGHQKRLTRDVTLLTRQPFGYGMGTTDRFSLRPHAGPGQLGPTESSYLSIALETGAEGLVLYLSALFATGMRVRAVRRAAIRARDQGPALVAAGAIGAMIAVSIAGLFIGVHELPIELVIWVPPGIALAWPIAERASQERRARARTLARA